MFNILHVWDIGGTSSVSLKVLKKAGYSGDVFMRSEHDPFGFTKFYGNYSLNIEGSELIKMALDNGHKYDIIHLNGLWQYTELFKRTFPNKKIIISYYGSDLTNTNDVIQRKHQEKFADLITVSTPDLIGYLQYQKETPYYYVPNVIDSDIYKPIENKNKKDLALIFFMDYIDKEATIKYLDKHYGKPYEIIDRDVDGVEPHNIPKLYSNYSTYLDIKILNYNGFVGEAMSKSGLEALACGLNVFNYENKLVNLLPLEHKGKYHIQLMNKIYNE